MTAKIAMVFIKFLGGTQMTYNYSPTTTVSDLKQHIANEKEAQLEHIILIFSGKRLTDDMVLADLRLQNETVLHCVIRPCFG